MTRCDHLCVCIAAFQMVLDDQFMMSHTGPLCCFSSYICKQPISWKLSAVPPPPSPLRQNPGKGETPETLARCGGEGGEVCMAASLQGNNE